VIYFAYAKSDIETCGFSDMIFASETCEALSLAAGEYHKKAAETVPEDGVVSAAVYRL